ncbi:hypothetical protein AK812_SmicGene3155 [Symbiodinium microadriaticum]|uniref:Uncharacterized protein n=1 Tax=Symbiodinium microadriaticum TaxID=2951 RepID=A0A1Q9EZQ3_SYMMI|nr:hypothetical protein AK812_SmicGene3155 [Symbiodinium microadriaticum]
MMAAAPSSLPLQRGEQTSDNGEVQIRLYRTLEDEVSLRQQEESYPPPNWVPKPKVQQDGWTYVSLWSTSQAWYPVRCPHISLGKLQLRDQVEDSIRRYCRQTSTRSLL